MRPTLFLLLLLVFGNLSAPAALASPATYCVACNTPAGLTVSNLTGTAALLSWSAAGGATQYTIEVEAEQNTPVLHIETNVSGTSYALTGLQPGGLYKFKVRTRCGGDKSDWSDWLFFTANSNGNGNGGSNDTCAVVTGLAANIAGDTARLHWHAVPGAVKYYLEIEDEQNNPGTFHLEINVTDTAYAFTGLQAGVLYKFKVRAHCANGQGVWSAWLFFNGNSNGNGNGGNGACSTPTGTTVTDITNNSALLSWNVVSGAAAYTLEIERNHPGSTPWKITQTVTTNSFLLTGLVPGARYKFKVRTNCTGGGHSDWAEWRKFKTTGNLTNTNSSAKMQDDAHDRANETATGIALQLWPNPAQDVVNIRLQDLPAGDAILRLYDPAGKMVREQPISAESAEWSGVLVLGDLSAGLYWLQIRSSNSLETRKLVIGRQ